MKQILILLGLTTLTACGAAETSMETSMEAAADIAAKGGVEAAAFTGAATEPASDNDAGLDFSVLPKGFPVLGEMRFSGVPQGCRLYKAAHADAAIAGDNG